MTPVATGHSALYKNVSVRQLLYCVVFVFQYQSDNSAGKLLVQMLLVQKKKEIYMRWDWQLFCYQLA